MSERCDVVVLGAGPVGLLYAAMLKTRRPETSVLVLDRAGEPGHKIGESTLSGFCKALRSIGIGRETMRRFFYPKNGLGFFHVDEARRRLEDAPEYILETFDETYQVERRVLDTLLLVRARRLGVEVRHGAAVDLARSTLSAAGNELRGIVDGRPFELSCSLLVDASGPAAILARHLGLRRDDASPFQTSAVWTYFEGIRPLAAYTWPAQAQFPRDQYTQHLCLREGWLWYIPLVSWQATPTVTLRRVLDRALDPEPPDRDTLARTLGGSHRPIVSVGLTLRGDRDAGAAVDPVATFARYQERYPAIAQLLAGAHRLEDYYGRGRTFQARASFRGYSERAAGDGWLLVGDAAFFVDPLISPGLTGGVAAAYQAIDATVRALDAGRAEARGFAAYDHFVHALHAALERDNQLVYMSFNHPRAIALVQRFQEGWARRHFLDHRERPYEAEDTNVWGILDPAYATVQADAWQILREAEIEIGRRVPVERQSCRDYEAAVRRLEARLGPHLDERLTPYAQANALTASC